MVGLELTLLRMTVVGVSGVEWWERESGGFGTGHFPKRVKIAMTATTKLAMVVIHSVIDGIVDA